MSMIATRAPLDIIGMSSAPRSPDRRGARLVPSSQEHESTSYEPARKRQRTSMTPATENTRPARSTQDGETERPKRKNAYDQESDGFMFTKRARTKEPSEARDDAPSEQQDVRCRRRLPATPEPAPRQRTKSSKTASPHKASHAQSHHNTERIPSPAKTLTMEKKRRKADRDGDRTSRVMLPASDTPIIRRNKAMRQSVAHGERRRSSSGMRGRRASDMMDGGKWNAMPHAEVRASEFYTMISPDLTEPRRMRLLLGWCGDRALPAKPQAPPSSSKQATEDFTAQKAARIIQEELSKELSTNGTLSDWFSRDLEAPEQKIVLRKKANPRNIVNAAKVEELEAQLQKLKAEREAWDTLIAEANAVATIENRAQEGSLSPVQAELLSPSQQEILAQLTDGQVTLDLDDAAVERRVQAASSGFEFVLDQLSHAVHAVASAQTVAGRVADHAMKDTAKSLVERDQDLAAQLPDPKVDAVDALRGLARALNARR